MEPNLSPLLQNPISAIPTPITIILNQVCPTALTSVTCVSLFNNSHGNSIHEDYGNNWKIPTYVKPEKELACSLTVPIKRFAFT